MFSFLYSVLFLLIFLFYSVPLLLSSTLLHFQFCRLAVTSRPILVVLNKVDLLRGDYAIGAEKSESIEENVQTSTYDGNNIRTPEAKLSFKKKLLQRKRDAILNESTTSDDTEIDSNISNNKSEIKNENETGSTGESESESQTEEGDRTYVTTCTFTFFHLTFTLTLNIIFSFIFIFIFTFIV